MERKLDAVVCGVGSGGTLTGLGRFFARVAPAVEMVLADPEGSILAPLVDDRADAKPPAPGSSRASARTSFRPIATSRA